MPIYALGEDTPILPDNGEFWIAPDAQVMGKVRLAPDTSIWFGAILRGDNELIDIGEGSNIQDGVVIHTDVGIPFQVGKGCTIGHRAILHGCQIGDNTLIGMGAVILNQAVIGKNCLVGANALVTEGKTFPDNSLIVGAPARAIRALTEDEVAKLAKAAQRYVANSKRFKAQLKAQP
ncbi:gamma carbonic anhydrase family protein [Microvirga sp. W0021]|uniref:Gamma carbonic anhydrase family protein n=1 Tax=Hohaiivirga grylli TaxID=3133970 RepID=A0ABV0BKI7_9HYPH